jgi:MoaA/NifB/PqqE/SkfB family radical SAM enzyme
MSKPIKSIKRIVHTLKNNLSKNHLNFIFFVTSKCNQRCEFCFYANDINKSVDLSLEEIKSLFSKIGNISNILFTGGEPTLRKDLLEIIDFLVKNNKLKSLTIPSNGMSPKLICGIVNQSLLKYPFLPLQVCISLDGPEDLHDKLRGVSGAYKKAIESIIALEHLAKQSERLSLNINTVITPKNVSVVSDIIQNVNKLNIKYYTHSFEIVRPENIKIINFWSKDIDELRRTYNVILQYKDNLYLKKLKCNIFMKLILGALQYANIYSLYKIQFDYLTKRKKWPMRCCAGLDNNVIYNNGDLSICELQEPFANIKDISDNEKLSDIFENERERTKNCSCTHLCYILLSMYKSKKMLLAIMPLRAIRYYFVKLRLKKYF